MPEPASPVLRTKLYRPPPGSGLVVRPRLLETLNQGMDLPLTVVIAPAGYGKTTLVTSWLETITYDYAWLSLDDNDANLATFVAYLLEALRQSVPTLGSTAHVALRSPHLSPPTTLADCLLQDLAGHAEPLFVVLDDYHAVSGPGVRAFMERLIYHLPPGLHFVLIARSDPLLSLGRLRGRQQITEVRSADLRFTVHEAAELLRHIAGENLASELIPLLAERTEGWPVGLQLAAISLRDSADHEAFARRFAEHNHQVLTDYLISEVLDGLPETQRALMLHTSILDRFCAPLCEVIALEDAQPGAGAGFIAALRRANLFVVALDDEGVWYRYHLLFRDLLRHQLRQTVAADDIAAQHRRASRWFEKAGLIEEAITHAIAGADAIHAAHLVESNVHQALNQENWRRLEHWLTLLPEPMLQQPALLIAQAYLQHFNHKTAAMNVLIEAAESALQEDAPANRTALLGAINVLRATSFTPRDPEDAVNIARLALTQLDPEMLFARSLAEFWLIYGLQQTGRTQSALELAYKLLGQQQEQPDVRTLRLLLAICGVHYDKANVPALMTSAATFLEVARRAQRGLSLGWANFLRGWASYQRNDLADAAEYFNTVAAMPHEVHSKAGLDSLVGLALTYHAQRREAAAQQALASLRKFLLDRGMLHLMPVADSLALRIGPPPPARESLAHLTRDLKSQMAADTWETPALTAVRLALRFDQPDRLAESAEVLRAVQPLAQARNNIRRQIEIGVLTTRMQTAQGLCADALETLRHTVLLAEPGGALRFFLDDAGSALRPHLEQLLAEGVAPAYIRSILAAYPPEDAATAPSFALSLAADNGGAPIEPASPDMLTNRELDVLLLLEQRLTNKEIAARLFISPRTVQKHTISIYEKLQVNNRRAAAARARALGLFSALS